MVKKATNPATILALPKEPLQECTPNLMPFHIAYTGPAPIGTYFLAKPTADKAPVPTPPPILTALAGDIAAISKTEDEKMSTAEDAIAEAFKPEASPPTRFVAAFRGRTVQGTSVSLPTGYTGLILRSSDASEPKDASDDEDADASTPVRMLTAESTFSSLLVWNADIPVDEARDQYLRSLSEWTRLAAEVRVCILFKWSSN